MLKYSIASCLALAVGASICIIDARSTGVVGSSRPVDSSPSSTGTIYATGIIEGATPEIHLRAEQHGQVREVLVTAGQWVEDGQVLVRLDDGTPQQESALALAKLELAKAELERLKNGARGEERDEARALVRAANARLEQAIRNSKRIEELRRDRAVTEQELDDQQALVDTSRADLDAAEARARQIEAAAREDELRAAEARVSAAQAELNLANIRLAKFAVRAPRRGRVLDVHIEPGELTGPDAREPLVVISDTTTVRVRAYVEELDAPRVSVGMSARVTADGLPNTSIVGTVASISPQMANKSLHSDQPHELYDTKTREVQLELSDVSNPIVGLRVNVQFTTGPSGSDDVGER